MDLQATFPPVLDSAMLADRKTCGLFAYRRHFLALQPKGCHNVDLHWGKCYATGLEVARLGYYRDGLNQLDATYAGMMAVDEEWGDFEADHPIKTQERCRDAVEFYLREHPFADDYLQPYTSESFEWTGVLELPFCHPDTNDPLLYAVRFDALCQAKGLVFILDDKTSGRGGANWGDQWNTRSQFLGYMYAVSKLLPQERVGGTVVRGLIVRKTGFECLEKLVPFRPVLGERWWSMTVSTVSRMVEEWKGGVLPDPDFDLGCNAYMRRCQFAILCESDNDVWLSDFEQGERWDPLMTTEK